MRPIKWYIKQLLPLKYSATYDIGAWKRTVTWHMWFGKTFNVVDEEVGWSEQYKRNTEAHNNG